MLFLPPLFCSRILHLLTLPPLFFAPHSAQVFFRCTPSSSFLLLPFSSRIPALAQPSSPFPRASFCSRILVLLTLPPFSSCPVLLKDSSPDFPPSPFLAVHSAQRFFPYSPFLLFPSCTTLLKDSSLAPFFLLAPFSSRILLLLALPFSFFFQGFFP